MPAEEFARAGLIKQKLELAHPGQDFWLSRSQASTVDETLERKCQVTEKGLCPEIAGGGVAALFFRHVSLLFHPRQSRQFPEVAAHLIPLFFGQGLEGSR